MEFIDVTIRESVYLKHGMTEQKALRYLKKYIKLMMFDEVKYLELCFLDNHSKGTLLYDGEFINAAYDIVKDKYGLTAVLHPNLVDLKKWDPEVVKKFRSVRFMINSKMDEHCEEIIDYLHDLGVNVSINVIYISRKHMDFVRDCLEISEKHNVETFTFADSCGSCTPDEVVRLLKYVKDNYGSFNRNFHFHDHLNLALTNAVVAMDYVDLMDCSVMGYGKGGGNLSLEDVLFTKRIMTGKEIGEDLVISYGKLIKYLVGEIFEEDHESALDAYKNRLIGIYNFNLKDIDELDSISGGDAIAFCKAAAKKGIQK